MGEKGIGRLAIASIGSQVLVLTKAKRIGEKHKIVAALISWGVFELPGLNLDQVTIPIREFEVIPSSEDVENMKDELINSLNELAGNDDISDKEAEKLVRAIKKLKIDPATINDYLPGKFSLQGDTGGTHFYISPVDEVLNSDIDGSRDNIGEATKVEKMLMGFTNCMTPDHPKPQITLAFRDFQSDDGTYYDLLDKEEFFTPEDFELADHHFEGTFDKYGQFSGTIKVYREKSFDHKIQWSANGYKETACGPFKMNVAYIQGRQAQSIIDPENYSRLTAKGDKYGGLYIYRDNIRILPYGNSDYDFIDIERNRTKSASYYFFSYRRMFGVIDISKKNNEDLKEKAGREGFIENKAYHQLQEILKNFFVQLAADFFREGGSGPKTEFWIQKRSEREASHKALKRRDDQARAKKEKFHKALNSFFNDLNNDKISQEIDKITDDINKNMSSIIFLDDPEAASQMLIEKEIEARQKIDIFTNRLKIGQPRGFTISKDTRRDYEAYLAELQKIELGPIQDAIQAIENLVEYYTNRLDIEVSKRKRLELAVEYISQEAKKAASAKDKEAKLAVSEVTSKVKELSNELMISLDDSIRDVKDRFKNLNIGSKKDFDLVRERQQMEADIVRSKDFTTQTLERVIQQLHNIYWTKSQNDSDIITSDQIADAMSEELEELRSRVNADIELSQLGLAVNIINHEFHSTVKSIRTSIRDLKAWVDVNDKLETIYTNIKINFEHLDKYLGLFTPLNRRMYREKESIPALEIKTFLIDLFKARFERHKVKFTHTKGFAARKIFGYRSTFYPVFVNLIDNAIHWMNEGSMTEHKVIKLHADDTGFYVSNNGPSIQIQDSEKIFDLGFTRKLNGRGMGLHISREVLRSDEYDICLDNPRDGNNVTFKIFPKNER